MTDFARTQRSSAGWLYGLFLAALLLDVGGAFGVKYLTAVLIAAFVVLNARHIRVPRPMLFVEGALFGVAPALLLCLAVARHHVPAGAAIGSLLFLSTWIVLPLLLLLPRERIIGDFTTAMLVGALLTLAAFAVILGVYLLGRLDLVGRINVFARDYNLGYFGQRPGTQGIAAFVPNVYFRWTMLLIPAAALLGTGSWRLYVTLAAIFATLSTGAIAFGVAAFVLGLLVDPRTPLRRLGAWAASAAAVGLVVAWGLAASDLTGLLAMVMEKFSGGSESTSIKLGHIRSIVELLSGDVLHLLFGTGIGSLFYSVGVDAVVSNVEVSHFNLLRQFGALYTLAFCSYVAWVGAALYGSDVAGRRLAVGIAMLFVAAGTNPLLLSPVFFLALIMGRAYVARFRRETADAGRGAPATA